MRRNRMCLLAFLTFFISLFYIFSSLNLYNSSNNYNQINLIDIRDFNVQTTDFQETKQWITNPYFDPPINQFWTNSKIGDLTDVYLTEGPGWVNYTVRGEQGIAKFEYIPPNKSDWLLTRNPDYPLFPNETEPDASPNNIFTIDNFGVIANHSWDENAVPNSDYIGQDPSVLWKRNVSTTVNMSDYTIISASITSIFNVSAASNVDKPGDSVDAGNTWDHVRFFIRISDLNATRNYIIAYYKYSNDSTLSDTNMFTVPKENLVFYLTSILEKESNFTITMGINFFCEDNIDPTDTDTWNYARIKSLNLTFSYEKKIDQNTQAYWSQTTDLLDGGNFLINEAILNFSYKIDSAWTNASPNSEFKIIINNNIHSETIKLSSANTSFQDASSHGFDVTPLLVNNQNISLSIELSIADNFILATNLTLSIDNVTLIISRTFIEEQEFLPLLYYLGGGGEPNYQLLILLIAIIAGIVAGFGAYQGYFKNPPTIRKIRKLKKNIKKGKTETPIMPVKRESLIQMNFKAQIEPLNLQSISSKQKIIQKSTQNGNQNKKGEKQNSKQFLLFLFVFFIILLIIFPLWNPNPFQTSNVLYNSGIFNSTTPLNFDLESKNYQESHQWIKNPSLDPPISQYWSSSKTGDTTDIGLTEDIGYVNYVVIGNNRTENYLNSPPNNSWIMMRDPDHPTFPNDTTIGSENAWCWIDGNGAFANQSWDENAGNQIGQDPGVLWKRNFTTQVNMSDYIITSAYISTTINASPNSNVERSNEGAEQGRGDYVRFFIRISDLSGNYSYEVANYLHGGDTSLSDRLMNNVTQLDLMFYLTSVLQSDGRNFTITMGINFWCEDNNQLDQDEWRSTRIKSLNLSFSYQKKIDQNSHAYWSQTSDLLNGGEFLINEAKLYFQCKVNPTWSISSPNSEIKIIINNNTHSETIKLANISTIFQDVEPNGFDVTNLIVKNENISLSIEVYLADDFNLANNITLSIDNIRLDITRTIIEQQVPPPPLYLYSPSSDYTPITYSLIAIIASISAVIVSYLGYFRYPPMIRKIKKLRNNIKKSKSENLVLVKNREFIIQSQLKNELKTLNIEKSIKENLSKTEIKSENIKEKIVKKETM